MALSTPERRFIKYWEEQRTGGKTAYFALYIFSLTILYYIMGIAAGLLASLPFIKPVWLIILAAFALILAVLSTAYTWHKNEKKFKQIIRREIDNN